MRRLILTALSVLLASGLALSTAAADTVTGTVQSVNATTLVIRTDSGQTRNIEISSGVNLPTGLKNGDRVTVDFSTSGAAMTANNVTLVANMNRTNSDQDDMNNRNNVSNGNGNLPRTASPLPLVALLGVLALSGGFLLRRRRVS